MKNDKQIAKELAALTATAIPPAEESDSDITLSGKSLPVRDVVSFDKAKGNLKIDLTALNGHKVNDTCQVDGYGDVSVVASFGRLKSQPKVDENLKDKQIQILSTQIQQAGAAKDYGKVKELRAEMDAVTFGESRVVLDSNVAETVIPLGLGSIEGSRYVFERSPKGTVLWVDGFAHRLRYTVSRGLLEKEFPQPTYRQLTGAAKREQRKQSAITTTKSRELGLRVAWEAELAEKAGQ